MLNNRLVSLSDYPFDRLRALLRGIEPPAGLAPIAMHIGEPKHAPPDFVAEILAAHKDDWRRYPPPVGTPELIEAIAAWLTARFGLPDAMIDGARHIVPVAGTREALFLTALATLSARGKDTKPPVVLLPNPHYAVYYGAAVLAGAEPVLLAATPENGFQPDIASVDRDILARTELAYVNSPSNPQGAVASLDRLRGAIEAARAHDFIVAFDECYSEIHVGDPPPGGLEAAADLSAGVENVLVFHSLSKRSSAPGLRSGFVAGDADFIKVFKTLRQYGGATVPVPIQAASAALWRDEAHVAENQSRYREKFETALEIFSGRLGAAQPGGGFFLWLDVGDGEKAAKKLWAEGALQVLPGRYYAQDMNGGNPGTRFIRVALVHETETVRDGIGRIAEILAGG